MIGNKWICEPDDKREVWCFLKLVRKRSEKMLAGWEISYGNPEEIVRSLDSKGGEEEILHDLLEQLYRCKSEGITVFTFGESAFQDLRTRCLLTSSNGASLRGVENLSIERLMEENFSLEVNPSEGGLKNISSLCEALDIQIGDCSDTELLWKILLRIGPLLPEDSLTGARP